MRRPVPLAVALVTAVAVAGCSDLREFRGPWSGPRLGTSSVLRAGAPDADAARLDVIELDRHGLRGRLTVAGLAQDAAVASEAGAEADTVAGITFPGDPLRVYLAFVAADDGGGDALAMIALFDDDRIELRLLRGGPAPLYAIFALTASEPPTAP